MATVIYDGNALIPAPFCSIARNIQRSDDGTPIGVLYSITLSGKLVAWMGSPDSTGTFWTSSGYPADENIALTSRMASLLRKQEALMTLFDRQGKTLEISPPDGSSPFSCNPRILDVNIPQGQWAQSCDYTITMEADSLSGVGQIDAGDELNYHVSHASDEWAIETLDERLHTYRMSHTASATGKRTYSSDGSLGKEAWENARDYVLGKIGLGLRAARMEASGVINGSGLQAFNYLRSQQLNELGGTFAATETWLCYDAGGVAAYEETNVSVRQSVSEGRTAVTVEGTITGLQVSDNSTFEIQSSRYEGAQAKWALVEPTLLTRAQTTSGITLNPTPMSKTTGYNEVAGTITYAVEYDTRATPSVAGALSEIVTVTGNYPSDVFAAIAVPGRAAGPVLQSIGTIKERRTGVSVEITTSPMSQTFTPTKPDASALILTNAPVATQVFVEDDQESWTPYNGRYTRTTSFVWQ